MRIFIGPNLNRQTWIFHNFMKIRIFLLDDLVVQHEIDGVGDLGGSSCGERGMSVLRWAVALLPV